MDEHEVRPGGAGEPNLFQPDEVAVPVAGQQITPDATPVALGSSKPNEAGVAPAPPQRQAVPQPVGESLAWTATEYIEHKKNTGWFFGLAAAALCLGVAVWFIARDIFLTAMVVFGAAIFGVYAARRPKETSYGLEGSYLTIGSRSYDLGDFRSFSVTPEGPLLAIELTPMKRFATYTVVYCHPKDQEKIAELLSAYLPMTPPRNDLTDQFLRRIHF